MSKSSKTSIRSFRKYGLRRKNKDLKNLLKPYNFCCDINNHDEETRYDKRNLPFSSSLMVLSPIQESPTLKFRYQFTEPAVNARRKSKPRSEEWNLGENPGSKTRGPLLWYQEDELEVAKNQFWSEKQKLYNEEADKNALIGEKKGILHTGIKAKMGSMKVVTGPRWYQDLSIPQHIFSKWHKMKQVLALEATMTADYEETITVRTQKALAIIGVTSTFCRIDPPVIKKLQRRTQLQPVQFLREIYRRVTGQYFEEEEYKKTYDCNERIILSAIAFLTLPDAVLELNNRLPPISESVFPPKRKLFLPYTISRNCTRHSMKDRSFILDFEKTVLQLYHLKRHRVVIVYKSPYMEPLSLPPDWAKYRTCLDKWRAKCKVIPRPRIILPQLKKDKPNDRLDFGNKTYSQEKFEDVLPSQNELPPENGTSLTEANVKGLKTPFDFSTPTLQENHKQTFDFTFSGLGEKSGPVNYEICGTLKPPFPKRKSWLGEKEAHYIVSGISEHENPPTCPVTYVMTGISCVTPNNSDEQFFAELKLGDGPKRVYPTGRKNLSKNWQEWLQDADEQFLEVEREANKIIKSVEATMRLVIPKGRCDACCSCRQTRKTDLKSRSTKTPYMVIDSIAEGDNQNRYIIGSLAMHSPGPSPTESTVNLLEVVASKETVQKKLLINGITNDSGETTYYISGVTQETQHIPRRTIVAEHLPKPLRNVPPCACTIEQMFNEEKTPSGSGDDIPQTKKEGVCCGHKYRPNEPPAITCKKYPGDRSCRRNPFDNKLKRAMLSRTETLCCDEADGPSEKKKMFTLPAFAPCGDEDGMAICGGPWGAKNIPDPKVIAAREAEAKQILKAPPCGDTPGRAVCGGPWGAVNPSPKVRKSGDDEEEDEEDEDEESEMKGDQLSPREQAKLAKEAKAKAEKLRRERLKRDNLCSARFEDELSDKADGKRSMVKEAPPVYCDFDNQWNRMRTAPTTNPWHNEYEKSLKLTQAVRLSSNDQEIKTRGDKEGGNSLKRKQKTEGPTESNCSRKNESLKEDTNNIRSNVKGHGVKTKDNVEVIYSGKQVTEGQPRLLNSNAVTNGQQSNAKSGVLASECVRTNSLTYNKNRIDSSEESRTTRKAKSLKSANVSCTEKKSQPTKFAKSKKIEDVDNRKRKRAQSSEKSNDGRSKRSMKNDFENEKDKERLKKITKVQKSPPQKTFRHERDTTFKKHKTKVTPGSSSSAPQAQAVSRVGKKSDEYKVAPAIIPNEPRMPCQRQDTQSDSESDNCGCSDDGETSMNNKSRKEKEGPFGWRTKSQQALPREKTLVYLVEPPDQVDMVKVREGGRPCKCRENRNKKKILIYNIGGAVSVSKGGRKNDRPQLIEGVTYVTPPQSPRNSSEYIPEYELFESPYKMCERKRSDQDLKYIDEISTPQGLSPKKETNKESCACRDKREECIVENLPDKEKDQRTDDSKAKTRSSALKDDGLIDFFTSCQDAVPCWLKCAKFSKAGCCAKPKLLQVKKPVCECRYERRVVKREEEKQKWFDRQQRLRAAKKQPYMQVAGTSRPMGHDTKLIISSVKKVLRDGEFIPESQYCVSGVAENYAMGPPRHIVPGITMQSPLVTPEPSKPDILCMCGHRHWSPTDITAGGLAPEGLALRAIDYPCRGREQRKEIPNDIGGGMEESLSIDDSSKPYVAYHSCADGGGGRSSIAQNGGQLHEMKKCKLKVNIGENEVRNANRDVERTKLGAKKITQSLTEEVMKETTQASTSKNRSNVKKTITTRSEEFENAEKQQYHSQKIASSTNKTPELNIDPTQGNSEQDKSTSETKRDLYELMKDELQKMASEDFILAKLPECWLIPQLRSWIEYREGKVITDRMKNKLCDVSRKRWGMMQQTKKPSIPPPSLQLTPFEIATMTFDRAIEMKEKTSVIKRKYYSQLRKMRVCEARSYWPTMEFGKFPSLSFKEAYFTYMAGKEADGHVFRPWKLEDSKNH
ncbi:LOW QUALITY PROTEIN: uncharacterized protein LOC124406379 [Diprion similis]|uniref:LOW QUALITY PROTEIN: uncharacterized protein LOC124406379 n=1 Tax=Diprion similis TaxID=362088 RepID=UPI001EF7D20C|nr:LOW QUALITY PROTEIN: uncharacterized protein LOC124406379 [Diprion similis]